MCTFKIILMNTYKVNLKEKDRNHVMEKLNMETSAVIYEKYSEVCYFILRVADAEIFLASIQSPQAQIERVDIMEIKDNYIFRTNFTIAGNSNLVPLNLVRE